MIVGAQSIESQEELQIEMDKAGFPCTQTTLSRDLKQLRISKVRVRNGRSVYALPGEGQYTMVPTREEQDRGRWGASLSGNLMVIHTPPGHANMVAYDIDCRSHKLFLGTVAGDDTVFVVLAEHAGRDQVRQMIQEIVPSLQGKVNF